MAHPRLFEERETAAIKTAVADKHERSFTRDRVLRLDPQDRRRARSDLDRGNEVTERTETAFESVARFLHRLGIETHAGELHEMFAISARQIHTVRSIPLNDFP